MRNIHTPRGIHAHKDASGAWEWMMQDGLGSLRGVANNSVGVLESRNYDPYGESFGAMGSSQTSYGFTGEPPDSNGLLYLRARYYNPAAGVFTARDPFEGRPCDPMSLNGYSYVAGNPINMVDPSGMRRRWCPDGVCKPPAACFALVEIAFTLLEAKASIQVHYELYDLTDIPVEGDPNSSYYFETTGVGLGVEVVVASTGAQLISVFCNEPEGRDPVREPVPGLVLLPGGANASSFEPVPVSAGFTPPLQPVCEPPPPYGRGCDIPQPVDPYIGASMTPALLLAFALTAGACGLIFAPQVTIPIRATCASNPQLCFQPIPVG